MRVYICGPMRGIPQYNFQAFDEAAAIVEAKGHTAVSPADIDRQHGFDALKAPAGTNWTEFPPGMDVRDVARRDLIAISYCDAMVVLPGWEDSRGALAEYRVAVWLGLDVHTVDGLPRNRQLVDQK